MTTEHEQQPLLVALAGPTASGKTALAMRLAEELGGEIVSCDSVAVYRGLDIGSAKPTPVEQARVPHHGIDLYAPNEACTAGDYARAARAAVVSIAARGRLPIVAGGTGLYLRALLDGLAPAPVRDEPLRERLRRRRPPSLHRILRRLDPQAAARIHPHDVPKLVRALEVTLTARTPQTTQWQAGRAPLTGFRVLRLALAPPRAALYGRINARCSAMFAAGLVEETAGLRARFGPACRALGSLGYAQAGLVLDGACTLAAAIAATQQGHRNLAKRQMTWFRREPIAHWIEGFGDDAAVQAAALAIAAAAR